MTGEGDRNPSGDEQTVTQAGTTVATLPDPRELVDRHGDYLYRYAIARVGDPELAKDLVQETLLAAVQGGDRFSGRSSPKTWLVAIMRHKIVDHFRRSAREWADLDPNPEDGAFDASGRWSAPPADWRTDPGIALDRAEFWEALRECLTELPRRQATAFSLREIDGLDTEELCQVFETTATNVWVLVHRARMALRRCLEASGFGSRGLEG